MRTESPPFPDFYFCPPDCPPELYKEKEELQRFLSGWEWGVFFTLTFRGQISPELGDKITRYFMTEHMEFDTSWCYFVELNPSRPGCHIHGMTDNPNQYRKPLWEEWFRLYGRNEFKPIKETAAAVSAYAAKQVQSYVAKDEGRWWIHDGGKQFHLELVTQ